jgi:WD40 repeat protein
VGPRRRALRAAHRPAPYGQGSALALLERIRNDQVRSPAELEPDAPAELCAVCHKALSRDHADRYADAAELVRDIEAFQEGRRVGAYAYNNLDLVRRFIARNRFATGVVAVTAVLLVLAAGLLFRAWRVAEQARAEQAELRELAEDRAELARAAGEEARENASVAHANLARALTATARRRIRDARHAEALVFAAGAADAWHLADEEAGNAPTALEAAELTSVRYDALLGRRLRLEPAISETLRINSGAALSPDGSLLADIHEGTLTVRRVPSGETVASWDAAGTRLVLGISSDNARLVSGFGTDAAVTWDLHAAVELGRTGTAFERELREWAITPDGRTVAHVRADGTIPVWSLSPAEPLATVQVPRAQRVALSDDGSLLVVGDGVGGLHFVDLPSGRRTFRDTGQHGVMSLQLIEGGRELVLATEGGAVSTWDVATRRPTRDWTTGRQLNDLACLGRCDTVLLADKTRVEVRDRASGRLWTVLPARGHSPLQVWGSPRGSAALVMAGNRTSTVTTAWTVVDPAQRIVTGGISDVVAAAFDPTGTRIATGTSRGRLALHDLDRGTELASTTLATGRVQSIRFAPGADAVAILDAAGDLHRLEAPTLSPGARANVLPPLGSRRGLVDQTFAWTDAGIATTGIDNRIHLRGAAALDEAAAFEGLTQLPWAVAASPTRLAATSMTGELAVWSLPDGDAVHLGNTGDSMLLALDVSPDGERIAWSGAAGVVHLVAAESGEVLRTLEGHDGFVNRVRFSPDGRHVLTGSEDGSARLWDAATGTLKQIFHTGIDTMVVDFSPRGERLIVGFGREVRALPLAVLDPADTTEAELLRSERQLGWRLTGVDLEPMALGKD